NPGRPFQYIVVYRHAGIGLRMQGKALYAGTLTGDVRETDVLFFAFRQLCRQDHLRLLYDGFVLRIAGMPGDKRQYMLAGIGIEAGSQLQAEGGVVQFTEWPGYPIYGDGPSISGMPQRRSGGQARPGGQAGTAAANRIVKSSV